MPEELLKWTRLAMRCLLLCVVLTVTGLASAAESVTFNRDIRPILSDKCYACHGPDKGHRKTDLRFDNEEGALVDLKAGGKAIIPGDVKNSILYQRLVSDNEVLRMPPAYLGHDKLSQKRLGSFAAGSSRARDGKSIGHLSLRAARANRPSATLLGLKWDSITSYLPASKKRVSNRRPTPTGAP